MKQLVIGMGEIGMAIGEVLFDKMEPDNVKGYDFNGDYNTDIGEKFDVLHICFPPSDKFIAQVEQYKKDFLGEGGLVIVHSSVDIGTCDKLNAVSSPVRGIHPNLVLGIKTFVKYFGGKDAYKAAKLFEAVQVQTKVYERARDVEGGKMADTSQFGIDIIKMKMVKAFCDKYDLNFEIVWTDFNKTYNEGYRALGKDKYSRPYFDYVPGKIGGHCVMQNCDLIDTEFSDFIKKFNEKL